MFEPTYRVGGVLHYGVANMPALVPRTSTFALTNATLPYVLQLAAKGPLTVARESSPLTRGINIWGGRIVHPAIAESLGEPVTPLADVAK